jgi:predicted transcriptional regulator
MGRAGREITDAELAVLNELWQRPSATVQELTEALYGNTAAALLATVRKLLDRLEAEGCVSRDRDKWPHHYSAVLKREELAGKRLQEAADELFDGDLAPLLSHLVRSQKLSAKDRENLRQMLDELDGKGPKKGK